MSARMPVHGQGAHRLEHQARQTTPLPNRIDHDLERAQGVRGAAGLVIGHCPLELVVPARGQAIVRAVPDER